MSEETLHEGCMWCVAALQGPIWHTAADMSAPRTRQPRLDNQAGGKRKGWVGGSPERGLSRVLKVAHPPPCRLANLQQLNCPLVLFLGAISTRLHSHHDASKQLKKKKKGRKKKNISSIHKTQTRSTRFTQSIHSINHPISYNV